MKNIQEKGENGIAGTDDIPTLQRKLNDYMHAMKILVSSKCHTSAFREEAYTSLCDGLIVFCQQLATQKWMENLVYKPDEELQELLNEFLNGTVFLEVRDGTFYILSSSSHASFYYVDYFMKDEKVFYVFVHAGTLSFHWRLFY